MRTLSHRPRIGIWKIWLVLYAVSAPLVAGPESIAWDISGEIRGRFETLDGQFR